MLGKYRRAGGRENPLFGNVRAPQTSSGENVVAGILVRISADEAQ